MSNILTIDKKEYVVATVAGKQFGYTKDYLLMLAKQGKIDGKKIGNKWYINVASAAVFFRDSEARKIEHSKRVSAERRLELKKYTRSHNKSYSNAALVETFVIVIIGLSLGVTGYIGTSTNIATVQSVEHNFFESLVIYIYEFISPDSVLVTEETKVRSVTPDNSSATDREIVLNTEVETITHTSLVVAPDEIFTDTTIESVRSAFSDEVEVSIDLENPDTGIIVPIFKEKSGDNYRFLMVPVNEANNSIEIQDL